MEETGRLKLIVSVKSMLIDGEKRQEEQKDKRKGTKGGLAAVRTAEGDASRG